MPARAEPECATDGEEMNTNRETPLARAASSTVLVPVTLAAWNCAALPTTPTRAARWMTASIPAWPARPWARR